MWAQGCPYDTLVLPFELGDDGLLGDDLQLEPGFVALQAELASLVVGVPGSAVHRPAVVIMILRHSTRAHVP